MTVFAAGRFHAALTTTAIGRTLDYHPRVDSTMPVARARAAAGAPAGTLVLAEEQTAGAGRRGRSFYSPPGENVYATFILRLPAAALRRLPLAVPLAVCVACAAEGVPAAIKWPNDVWAGQRKLSGMLIDLDTPAAGDAIAFAGIGINVNGDPTRNPELRDTATSLAREAGRAVDRELLLARLCNELERWLAAGPEELALRYREESLILGRRIVVHDVGGEVFEGEAIEVEEGGSLLVRRDDGPVVSVTAADVSIRPVPGDRA